MIIPTVSFIAVLVNVTLRDSSLIRQFFLIPNIINEFVELLAIFQFLLESVLPEIDYYLRIYTFSRFQ
jgi:hypothetical protein